MYRPKKDRILHHIVSPGCRFRVSQIALFQGLPEYTLHNPTTGHSVGTNVATTTPNPKNAPVGAFPGFPRDTVHAQRPSFGTGDERAFPNNGVY